MSATVRTITLSVAVWDLDHIRQHMPNLADEIEASDKTPDDWAVEQLEIILLPLVNGWMRDNPHLFRVAGLV